MREYDNPYTPNARKRPLEVSGREEDLRMFETLLRRVEKGRSAQPMIVTGLRGVGKTVLLGMFREQARRNEKWVCVQLEAHKNDNKEFRLELGAKLRAALIEISPKAQWDDTLRRVAGILKSFTVSVSTAGEAQFGFDIEALEGHADSQILSLDLADVLVALGEAAKSKNRCVVLLIDEMQFLDSVQLEAIIEALHKVAQEDLPVTLAGAALPQIAELAGNAKSYAERLFVFRQIGNLSRTETYAALKEPAQDEDVSYSIEALDKAHEITEGYPYFIQELGYAAWNVAEGPVEIVEEDIERAVEVYEAKLDSSFFRVRLDRTTDLEKSYMRAMAELGPGPQKASTVADKLERKTSELGATRSRLIEKGMLYQPQHGYAAFTVPHFDRFMKREIPAFSVPQKKQKRQE